MTATPPFMSLAPRPCTAPSAIRPGTFACAGTVSRCPARTIGPSPYSRTSPSSYDGAPGISSRTSATIAASERLSEGTSTRPSVVAARSGVGTAEVIMAAVAVRQPDPTPGLEPERGLVVAVLGQAVDADDELGEFEELARTAGVKPVARVVQHRPEPDPRSYVGKGKLDELKHEYGGTKAEVLLVDAELSPSQQRLLENTLQARVVDRTQLILDIFAQHEYNLPRMRGMWKHLERLGGGVGTRGPGESQLESDRRQARRRVSLLKDRLEELSKQRDVRRKERRRTQTPTVALAGYTNVGKSTLLNALTDATVSVRNRLFETLDPTTRGFEYDGRRYLVTDTVGFVRRLPHQLVEGFAATLEETLVADLILHVIDASADEAEQDRQREAVEDVLHEIGAAEVPLDLVLNKIDLVDALGRRRLANRFPGAPQVSSLTGEGLDDLRAELAHRFDDRWERVRLLVPYEDGSR